jgi:hypothetical protein
MLDNLPGVLAVQANAGLTGGGGGGNNSGSIFVRLKPIAERDVSQQALMLRARKLVQPFRKAAVISVQGTGGLSFAGGRGAQIQYALVGPDLASSINTAKALRRWRRARLPNDRPSPASRAAHRHDCKLPPTSACASRRVADRQRPHRRPVTTNAASDQIRSRPQAEIHSGRPESLAPRRCAPPRASSCSCATS